jgi:hypothetical protein
MTITQPDANKWIWNYNFKNGITQNLSYRVDQFADQRVVPGWKNR